MSWCSGMIRGAPSVIRCSVSASSAICCSVAPGPLVSVLLDAESKGRKTLFETTGKKFLPQKV